MKEREPAKGHPRRDALPLPGIPAVSRYFVARPRCSRRVPPLPVETVPFFGGQLARKGAHDALGDCVTQELGLAVNALSSAGPAAMLMLERSPRKLDHLDLWQRLAEKADAGPILNPNATPPGGVTLR